MSSPQIDQTGTITETPASKVSSASASEEAALPDFANIMARSPIAKLLGLDGQKSEDEDEASDAEPSLLVRESSTDAEEEPAEDASDEASKAAEEDADTTEADETDATSEASLPVEDDIDWNYKIPVKVNGKVEYKTLEEVRNGFVQSTDSTAQAAKAEATRKELAAEREEKLASVTQLGALFFKELMTAEKSIQEDYTEVMKKIQEARQTNDSFALNDLKDKKEVLQERFNALRAKREAAAKAIAAETKKAADDRKSALLSQFQVDIATDLPGFNEELGIKIRDFAIKEGIPEAMLEEVYSAKVVKFINDYRLLKAKQTVGETKRKQTPASKGVPLKQAPRRNLAGIKQQAALRERVMSGNGNEGDELAYLASLSRINMKL